MNMQEIRERAGSIGLAGIGKLRKAELIRTIQQAEGNNPCYGADWRQSCDQFGCCWREDCVKE